jgi:hypothetical protein
MQTKDYLTLLVSSLALLLSIFNFVVNYRKGRDDDALKASTRKNEVLIGLSNVQHLIADVRFYDERITRRNLQTFGVRRMLGEAGPSLQLDDVEKFAKAYFAEIQAYDPRDIATKRDARTRLEEVHGSVADLAVKLSNLVADLKRHDEEQSKKERDA